MKMNQPEEGDKEWRVEIEEDWEEGGEDAGYKSNPISKVLFQG